MLDDRAYRRLTEMGIDAYVLRERIEARTAAAAQHPAIADGSAALRTLDLSITIVADVRGADARPLADFRRALRMAGVTSAVAMRMPATTDPVIVFGAVSTTSRAADEPRADRVFAGDWARLRRDPAAKRALWREILMLLRVLADAPAGRKD